MNTKAYLLLAIVPALSLPSSTISASPLVSIGDGADLFFNGSSSLRWSSNLFRDESDEQDDLTWVVSPGLELNVGRGLSNADLSIITRYDIIKYEDNDEFDTETFHIKAIGSYRASRWDVNGQIAFDEFQNANSEANRDGQFTEGDDASARLNGEYRISPKFSIGSSISWSEREYTKPKNEFADYTNWAVPVDVYYELTPKIDLSVGYRYGLRDVDSYTRDFSDVVSSGTAFRYYDDYETTTHFVNVGARGELLPKVTGFFKVGYTLRDSDSTVDEVFGTSPDITPGLSPRKREDSDGTLGLNADLTWAATPKLTHSLKASRRFGVSGEGDTTTNTSLKWLTSYAINSQWSASGSLGYTLREYEDDNDREDNEYYVGLRGNYTPNRFWSFSAGYRYSENDSDEDLNSYEDHTVDFIVSLRYLLILKQFIPLRV